MGQALDGGGMENSAFSLDIPLDLSSAASASSGAIGGRLIFGDYPQASPVVNTNAGDGSIDMRAATGPLASVGIAWWQWLIVGGIAWGLLRGGK